MSPPRPRFGSHPDREAHAPEVYEILEKHDGDIAELKGLAQEGKLADAKILDKLEDIKATDRHATTKLIASLIVTVITTVGGVIGGMAALRPADHSTPNVPSRSALDVRLDQCRPMPPSPSREECFTRVTAETDH